MLKSKTLIVILALTAVWQTAYAGNVSCPNGENPVQLDLKYSHYTTAKAEGGGLGLGAWGKRFTQTDHLKSVAISCDLLNQGFGEGVKLYKPDGGHYTVSDKLGVGARRQIDKLMMSSRRAAFKAGIGRTTLFYCPSSLKRSKVPKGWSDHCSPPSKGRKGRKKR